MFVLVIAIGQLMKERKKTRKKKEKKRILRIFPIVNPLIK